MTKYKELFSTKIDGYKTGSQEVEFIIAGLFDSIKVHWDYYLVSTIINQSQRILTNDLSPVFNNVYTTENIKSHGKKFDTLEDGKDYLNIFKIKWETGSNNTIQEIRDKKLEELTNE